MPRARSSVGAELKAEPGEAGDPYPSTSEVESETGLIFQNISECWFAVFYVYFIYRYSRFAGVFGHKEMAAADCSGMQECCEEEALEDDSRYEFK